MDVTPSRPFIRGQEQVKQGHVRIQGVGTLHGILAILFFTYDCKSWR